MDSRQNQARWRRHVDTRAVHDQADLRYPGDLTVVEWRVIAQCRGR
jgi:hypothetical protein